MAASRRTTHWVTSLLLPLLALGCESQVPAKDFREVQRQLQESREEVSRLGNELAQQTELAQALQARIARQRGLTHQDMLDELVAPVRLELEEMSGGYDTDGQPGDDGIALFIRPIDRDGHAIKAAGSLRITILDPLSPPNANVVAEYHFDVPATRKLWYGRLWTYHFTVRCPWPPGQMPLHDEVTAHVAFTDLLTGKLLTTQKAFKITRPLVSTAPAASPEP